MKGFRRIEKFRKISEFQGNLHFLEKICGKNLEISLTKMDSEFQVDQIDKRYMKQKIVND